MRWSVEVCYRDLIIWDKNHCWRDMEILKSAFSLGFDSVSGDIVCLFSNDLLSVVSVTCLTTLEWAVTVNFKWAVIVVWIFWRVRLVWNWILSLVALVSSPYLYSGCLLVTRLVVVHLLLHVRDLFHWNLRYWKSEECVRFQIQFWVDWYQSLVYNTARPQFEYEYREPLNAY